MSESQLAENVRVALDEATAGLRVPVSAAAHARSKGRRRRVRRGLLAFVPVVAVITGVAVIAHGGSTPARKVSAAPSPSATVQTDAYVTHQVEAVLATADSYIITTRATSGPGQVTTTYLDPATGTTRSVVSSAGDKVTYWIQTRVSGNEDQWRTTYVDYTNHTWWTKDSHSAPLGNDTSNILVLSAQTVPAQISKALAQGQLRVGLKGNVNGHAAIELVYAGQLAGKAGAVRYWVDAATYQPIQIELPPFTAASTVTESWLAKTPATAAQTDKPRIPAGFRQVPPSSAFS
jgi:hypothetical protein